MLKKVAYENVEIGTSLFSKPQFKEIWAHNYYKSYSKR